MDQLKQYYEDSSHRFHDPRQGMVGRDLVIYPLLEGYSGSVLEYGCGCGSLLLGLALEERFTKCYGVDISEKALSLVRQGWEGLGGNQDKLELVVPENDRIAYIENESIDVLISVATIEHVINPYVVLDELYRVAKNDAVLICCVPNYAYLKHKIQILFGIQPRTGTNEPVENWRSVGWDGMHIHTFTKSSFGVLLNDCGWRPRKWSGWGERLSSLGLGVFRRRFPGVMSGEIVALCEKRTDFTPPPENRPAMKAYHSG